MHLLFLFLFVLNTNSDTDKWGQIGHYATGQVAEYHMTDEVKERVKEILGDSTTLQRATVWMDDIRSDSHYDYTSTWHWTSIPDGMTYDEAKDVQEEAGDIIWALETIIAELKEGGLSREEESEKLKFVIHMIGDIHQPMHVGTGDDQGGNQVRLQWMGDNSNLHRVWDSDIINSMQMSYTELAKEVNTATPKQVEEWQSATVRDWAYESMTYRERMYEMPENMRLGYEYRFKNKDIIFKRVLQAGVRMAGVLNEIYGE